MTLVLSTICSSPDLFPFGTGSSLPWLLGCLAQLWAVYLFLALLTDAGRLITILQGASPEEGFLSPLASSRCFQEVWGRRWNLVVHGYLKSLVYRPLRSRGAGSILASLGSFLASGLLHEYTFALHNRAAYSFGTATLFFVTMGIIMLVEQLLTPVVPTALQRAWAGLPAPLTASVLALLSCIPCEPLYMRSWRDSGMLHSLGQVVPLVRCVL